ncbi:MAG: hypothetical protein RIA08_09970 [Roseovarius sp.]|uniref:hypothetical protein n=1 Tax=Roseovarius sp. TaxID=1486281 RepID=UPI0032EC7FA1
MIGAWFSRTEQGFWCDFCGDLLKPDFHFASEEEWEEYQEWLEGDEGHCRNCGAPDDIDPEAI